MNDPAPLLPSKLLQGKKKCQRFPSRRQVTVLSAVCAYARVPVCPRCRCAKRRGLRFGPMKRRCPLQVPLPRCHPGTRTLTVIGGCVLLSLHQPPTPPPPLWPLPRHSCAPLLSGPHSPLLAFNAEPGSPLIKVKVSQCLDETERGKKGVGEGTGVAQLLEKNLTKIVKSIFTYSRAEEYR